MSVDKKILIIDDEPDLCLLLKEYFVRRNYNVYFTHTLTEGRQILNEVKPDILFLDNNLPDGLGWSCAPEIASDYPYTFIYLISAFHPDLPKMPPQSHFTVMEKPVSFIELEKQLSVTRAVN